MAMLPMAGGAASAALGTHSRRSASYLVVDFALPQTVRGKMSRSSCCSRRSRLKLQLQLQLSSSSLCGSFRHGDWNGLKCLPHPTSFLRLVLCREKKRKCCGRITYASLFGVGAPEALVIGVVALLVFGPKGLAEVARNLGKTLRSFQPTIKELQDVSREFRSTLEREIGLDEVASSANYKPTAPTTATPAAVMDPIQRLAEAQVATSAATSEAETTTLVETEQSASQQEIASTNASTNEADRPSSTAEPEPVASSAAPGSSTEILQSDKAGKN